MNLLVTLALAAAKTGLLLVVAAVAALALRRASARLRSLVWATAICGSLLVPALAVVGPSLEIALPAVTIRSPLAPAAESGRAPSPESTAAAAAHPTGVASGVPAPSAVETGAVPWSLVAIVLWLAGALAVLARQTVGWWRAFGAVRRGHLLDDLEWRAAFDRAGRRTGCRRPVRLLASAELGVPATLGVIAPVIVLPEHCGQWLADRRDAVLLHELVHVTRGDWALRSLARITVAVYWFNPLVWWAVRRLELEQELACDETVLALGERATDYASHLLGIARLAGRRPICTIPVAGMARRHEVEERIMAMLDRPRIHPATRTALTAAVLAIAALVPVVAAVQPETRQAGTELAQALADLREVEARLEPYHERLEEAAAEIELEAEGIEAAAHVDEAAMLEIERRMEPYLDRIAEIEIDMEPYLEQIEAASRVVESIELDIERGTIKDIHRQIEEQLKSHLANLEQLHVDLEPMHEQLEALHRELEPLHEHLAEVHLEMAPHHEAMARIHERMEPMHEAMESMHAEMEPLHLELEATANRVKKALNAEVEAELRERLGTVVSPGAPWSEAATRIVEEASLHIDDDLVRLNTSRSEVREILTDLMTPHRVGTEDAFAAALDDTAREISRFEVTAR